MNELGKKIFVSYKYKDNDVKMMPNVTQPTWPCDYVDYIKNKVLCDDDIYKGENSDEDISSWSEDAIWNHLKNKIYDSTLATVYKGNIIKNLIMDCQSYTKYRPNKTTGGIFVSWRRKEELPTGA